MTIKIWPEPWSPGVAHLIRTRAVRALAAQPDKRVVKFKHGPHYVTVRRE